MKPSREATSQKNNEDIIAVLMKIFGITECLKIKYSLMKLF